METQSLRIRLMFDDRSVSQEQRSKGMNHSWILIEPNLHPKISDVCNNLLHKFNLYSSCPNGILLFMEGFALPPSESTRILKDKDLICVRRNGIAFAEAIEGAETCNLPDEVNRREFVDNDMLLLENEEFDKETGGYQIKSEDAEVVKVEDEPSPKETTSMKRKASTQLRSSKKKKHHPSPLMVGAEDELATDENNISMKKIKPNEEVKKENAETSDKSFKVVEGVKQTSTAPDGAKKVPSRSTRRKKAKRRWRQEFAKISQNPDTHEYTNEIDQANNDESLQKKISKKKIKPNEEIKKENAETSDKNIKDIVEGVEQFSTAPDGATKVPSRSSRRKIAKRRWRQELAKISHNPDAHEYTNGIDQANTDESLPEQKFSKKKIKTEDAETSDKNINDNVEGVEQMSTALNGAKKVPSRSSIRKKAQRIRRRELAKISHNVAVSVKVEPDTHEYTNEIDQANIDESLPQKKIRKKKIKPNEGIKKEIAETSDKSLKDNVEEQMSTAPDGAKKVPSRSSRRKKAKRIWRRELAKISHYPDNHAEPEVPKTKIIGANDHPEGPIKMPLNVPRKNILKQEERNCNDDADPELAPCVVKPEHIQFELLDEDGDKKQIKSPDVAFRQNGITNNNTGLQRGLEKFSTFERDDTRKPTKESSSMLTVDTQISLIDLIDFDQLPLCNSPKEGDVIVYRVLELSSSWTPELSSFRVGKISFYDADNIVLLPLPQYPIIFDKMEEDGLDNSLYKEDGSLEIKFAALADVRSVKQSNSDVAKAVSNEKNAASNLMPNSNDNKASLSKNPSPVADNKEGNLPDEIDELLIAKKSEVLEANQEMKKDSGWKSYRALRGSALGPTMALLRSNNCI